MAQATSRLQTASMVVTALSGVVSQLSMITGQGAGLTPGATPTSPFANAAPIPSPNGSLSSPPPYQGIGLPNPAASANQSLPTQDTFQGSGDKAEINRLLEEAAQRYGIPPDILKAVAYQESTWRADASSFDGGHGKGVMQIDDRFHDFAKTPEVWDPAKNIDYGAKFLRELYDRHGDWDAALKGYNGGSEYPGIVMGHVQNRPWTQFA